MSSIVRFVIDCAISDIIFRYVLWFNQQQKKSQNSKKSSHNSGGDRYGFMYGYTCISMT